VGVVHTLASGGRNAELIRREPPAGKKGTLVNSTFDNLQLIPLCLDQSQVVFLPYVIQCRHRGLLLLRRGRLVTDAIAGRRGAIAPCLNAGTASRHISHAVFLEMTVKSALTLSRQCCSSFFIQFDTFWHIYKPSAQLLAGSWLAHYPFFRYVRNLESRVRELEKTRTVSTSSASTAIQAPRVDDLLAGESDSFEITEVPHNIRSSSFPIADAILSVNNMPLGSTTDPGQPSPGSLFEEIKLLSGEAIGERHLGSSSGFSFARLTQTVLRRLSPDKADFVFTADQEINAEQVFDFDSPSDALNSIFHTLDNSLRCYPTLFGNFSLSDWSEPEDVLAGLTLPDEGRLDHLVEFYFAHSHTLYPIIHRGEFISTFRQISSNPQHPLAESPLHMFRIWMVLAIGSTTHCSVMLSEESEPMLYYNKAMEYFEAAFGYGDMAGKDHPFAD
jgi:hypothetical protein